MATWQVLFLGIVGPLVVVVAVFLASVLAYGWWSRYTAIGRYQARIYDELEGRLRDMEREGPSDRSSARK